MDAAHAALRRRLPRLVPGDLAPDAAFLGLDLDAFLARTAVVPLRPAERLRQLAIFLEERRHLPCRDAPGWAALARVYDAALAVAPDDPDVWHSRGITALSCATWAPEAWADALHAATRAVALRPDDPDAHHLLGRVWYQHEPGTDDDLREARAAFARAVALDPHHGLARVHLANVLHDLGAWPEAAAAYDAVRPGRLPPYARWRWPLAREQRAWCLLHAGDRAGALRGFREVLRRAERAVRPGMDPLHPLLFVLDPFELLRAAAAGPLAPELGARVEALDRAVEAATA